MKINFTKMHGAGNDYIYVNCFENDIPFDADMVRHLSDRHFGIGGDGVIFVRPTENADAYMDMYNTDGSRGMMCGNGVRCVAKFAYDNKITDKKTVKIETPSGIKEIELLLESDEAVGGVVNMGNPIFKQVEIPAVGLMLNNSYTFSYEGVDYSGMALSMGNPHFVIFVEDVENIDLANLSNHIVQSKIFPEGVNVEVVKFNSPQQYRVRVFERGSGETLACGTGACAVAVAAITNGFSHKDTDIEIEMNGGKLVANWKSEGSVFLSGPATNVFYGTIDYTK
jgi:diaminopimelate epimerase